MIPLGFMIYSDFSNRYIDIIWLSVFAVLQLVAGSVRYGFKDVINNFYTNVIFLLILYLFLWFYVVIRHNKINSFRDAIGLGDLLFLPSVCFIFDLYEYVIFLTLAFIATLLGYIFYKIFSKNLDTIPLVGGIGICFMFYVIKSFLV